MSTHNYDVVVVGTGASGTSAAVTAAQRGAKVLLLEKGRNTGGSSNYTEGLFAVDSYLQREQHINVSKTAVLKEEVTYSKFRADSRIWRNYIDQSADTVEWLKDQGVEYEGVQAMGDGEATWHIYKGMGNAVIHDALLPKAEALGVDIRTSTEATAIATDQQHITSITIHDLATDTTETITTAAVILATGGYLNNHQLMQTDTHYDTDRLVTVSSGKGTGDGLQMAWNVGAEQYGLGTAMLFGGYLNDPDEPSFKMMGSEMNAAAGQQPLLWVNEDGHRFVDESVVYNFSYAGNALYTQNKVFSLLDSSVIEKMAKTGNYMGLGVYVKRGQKMTKLQEEIDAAVAAERPFIIKADTVEELAAKMHVDVANLTSTINQYNNDTANHQDTEFGKDAQYMVPLEKGPFYAFDLSVGAFCTMGGLKVTPENEVLDDHGQVITGLYAVGNDASGLAGDTYGPNMPGTCVGYAFYSGRTAGAHAATLAQG
ncbi:FAD-dependent oxidoreductase [Furfurilactobacillus sp. WILCCON 0119]